MIEGARQILHALTSLLPSCKWLVHESQQPDAVLVRIGRHILPLITAAELTL